MKIIRIDAGKRDFLPLLLLGDEQESMILRYLDRAALFALYDPDLRGVCAVTDEGGGAAEIKNIAVALDWQRCGYGRAMIQWVQEWAKPRFHTLWVGTGDSPLTVPFYQRCGFVMDHRVPGFFLKYYDHPIYEAGVQLVDMVYFKKTL